MYQYIMDWLALSDLVVSDDVYALITLVISVCILDFIFAIFKILIYTIGGSDGT